jgi:NAD-dependent SIR2 family protein deacetylase
VSEIRTFRKSRGMWNNFKKTGNARIYVTLRRVRLTIDDVEME